MGRKNAERTYLPPDTAWAPENYLNLWLLASSKHSLLVAEWLQSCKLHKPTSSRGSRKVYLGLSLLKEKKWFPFRSHSQYLVPYWLWLGYVPICEPNTDARENAWTDWSRSEPRSVKVSLPLKHVRWEWTSWCLWPNKWRLGKFTKRTQLSSIQEPCGFGNKQTNRYKALSIMGRKKMCTLWSLLLENLQVRLTAP